jgi:hypothetical protein
MSECTNMLMTGLLFNISRFIHCDYNHPHKRTPAHARNSYKITDHSYTLIKYPTCFLHPEGDY